MNVLLLSDHDSTRALLAAQLVEIGAKVLEAGDLDRGITALDRALPELMLVDLHLAGGGIGETLRRIRRAHPGVPVVVVTSHPYVDEVAAAFKAGAQDVLIRPIERDALDAALRGAAGNDDEGTGAPDDELWRALVRDASALVRRGGLARAERLVRQALCLRPERPDAYNLLGAIAELRGDLLVAQSFYRAALDIDPTFSIARENLNRTTHVPLVGPPLVSADEG